MMGWTIEGRTVLRSSCMPSRQGGWTFIPVNGFITIINKGFGCRCRFASGDAPLPSSAFPNPSMFSKFGGSHLRHLAHFHGSPRLANHSFNSPTLVCYEFRKVLGITNRLSGYEVLVDRKGRVRWRASEMATKEELESMVTCTTRLLQEETSKAIWTLQEEFRVSDLREGNRIDFFTEQVFLHLCSISSNGGTSSWWV